MHEEEKQYGKVYDSKIIASLMEFLIPYRKFIMLVLITTVLLVGLNLYLPILVQKTIDSSISVVYSKIKNYNNLDLRSVFKLNLAKNKHIIGKDIFIYKSDLGEIFSSNWIKKQKENGFLEKYDYYVGISNKTNEKIIQKYINFFELENKIFAIKYKDIKSNLNFNEKIKLKINDIIKLKSVVLIFISIIVLSFVLSIIKALALSYSQLSLMKDIKVRLYMKTLNQSLKFLQINPVGKLVTRITNDVQTVSGFINTSMDQLLSNITMLIGASIMIFLLDYKLSLVLLATMPVLIIVTIFYKKLARKAFRVVRYLVSNLNIFLSENFSGIEVLKHFAHEDKSIANFKDKSNDLFKAQKKQLYVFAFFRPFIRFIGSTSIAIIIYYSAKEVLEYRISLGVLIAFLNLLDKFYGPVAEIAEIFSQLQQAMAGGERVFDLMDQEEHIEDNGMMILRKKTAKGEIKFDDVHFSYTKDKQVINGMTFTIKPGETVALVGYTGSGKTTITNLITRMWDVQNGQILLDGINIKNLKLKNLRSSIQSLQQDVFLFNDTIKNNILMGLKLDDKTLNKIIDSAQLNELLNSLDNGIEHIIEEGSKNISAGQKQLIAFARILAQDPKVIIMDEATANIDTETEKKIQVAMNELTKGRTAIIVAHRLSTIQHADKILVLKNGHLVEEGPHDKLIQVENGLYQNLYKLQYQEQLEVVK